MVNDVIILAIAVCRPSPETKHFEATVLPTGWRIRGLSRGLSTFFCRKDGEGADAAAAIELWQQRALFSPVESTKIPDSHHVFSPSGRPPSTQEACAIQRKWGHCCGGAPHALWRPWRVSRKLLVILCCACNCGSPSIILRKMRVIVLAAFALLPASVTCFSSVSARTSASLPRVHLRSQAATTYVDGQARVGPEAATLPTPTEAAELGVVVPTRPQPADDLLPAPTTKEVVTFGMPVSALFISNFALGAVDTAATGRFGGLMDLAALAPGTAAMEYACYVLSAIATVTLNQLAPTQPGGKEWNERLALAAHLNHARPKAGERASARGIRGGVSDIFTGGACGSTLGSTRNFRKFFRK